MNIGRSLTIVAFGISLAAVKVRAGPEVRGLVMQARHAHVNASEVTNGTTVYDGDQFSTEEDGTVRLRSEDATVDLLARSRMVVRGKSESSKDAEITLLQGGVVFFATRASAMELGVEGARIHPVADVPTTAEVDRIGAKELRIYARRGDLQLTYREETEIIPQGKNCRVLLDPGADEAKGAKPPKNAGPKPRPFWVIPIVAGGVILGKIISDHVAVESPDRP